MPDNVYTETIRLDNSSMVAGMQQLLAPIQQVAQQLQALSAQLGQLAGAQSSSVTGLQRESAALRENANAIASNASIRRAAMQDDARRPEIKIEGRGLRSLAAEYVDGAGPGGMRGSSIRDDDGGRGVARRSMRQFGMMGGILGVEMLGAGLRAGGHDTAADTVAGVGGRGAAWGVSGAMMGGPYGALAGALAGMAVGVLEMSQRARKKEEAETAASTRNAAGVGVAEIMGNRALYATDTAKEMDAHLTSMQEQATRLRIELSAGVIAPEDVAKTRAIEASLGRQIALGQSLREALAQKDTTKEENTAAVSDILGDQAIREIDMPKAMDAHLKSMSNQVTKLRLELSGGLIPAEDVAKVEALEASLTRQITLGNDLRKSLVMQDAAETSNAKMQVDALRIREGLRAGVEAAMSATGANSYTQQGWGTGTPVGAMNGGVESRIDKTNALLEQLKAAVTKNPQQFAGVFQ